MIILAVDNKTYYNQLDSFSPRLLQKFENSYQRRFAQGSVTRKVANALRTSSILEAFGILNLGIEHWPDFCRQKRALRIGRNRSHVTRMSFHLLVYAISIKVAVPRSFAGGLKHRRGQRRHCSLHTNGSGNHTAGEGHLVQL